MRKHLIASILAIGMAAVGCAGAKKQEMGKDTVIKCPKCGVEFPAHEGMHKSK